MQRIFYIATLEKLLLFIGCLVSTVARADLARRLDEVLITDAIPKSELLRPDDVIWTAPKFHDRGVSHREMFLRPTSPPRLIKLMDFSTSFARNLHGQLLGETVGGPRVTRAGSYRAAKDEGHFVEMEMIFPGDPTTFTRKGTEAVHRGGTIRLPVPAEIFEERLYDLADLVGRTLDAQLQMYDIDFIMSSTAVRWIDTEEWTEGPTFDPHVLRDLMPTILFWIDAVEPGLAEVFYRALVARVERSGALNGNQRRAILGSISQDWFNCQWFLKN